MQKKVVLYTAPGCPWCTKAKQLFARYEIRYKQIDVSRDRFAQRDCQKHGCRGIPVIVVEREWICGFNEAKIKKALNL